MSQNIPRGLLLTTVGNIPKEWEAAATNLKQANFYT